MGWVKGLEPSTPGTTIRCSNQLSYTHHILYFKFGTPRGIRTPDLLLRRQLLYPAELLAHILPSVLMLERAMGIEPTYPAWKAGVLPLNYARRAVPMFSLKIIPRFLPLVNIFAQKILNLQLSFAFLLLPSGGDLCIIAPIEKPITGGTQDDRVNHAGK